MARTPWKLDLGTRTAPVTALQLLRVMAFPLTAAISTFERNNRATKLIGCRKWAHETPGSSARMLMLWSDVATTRTATQQDGLKAGLNPVKAVNAKCVNCKLHIANLTSDSSIHSPNHSRDGVWCGGASSLRKRTCPHTQFRVCEPTDLPDPNTRSLSFNQSRSDCDIAKLQQTSKAIGHQVLAGQPSNACPVMCNFRESSCPQEPQHYDRVRRRPSKARQNPLPPVAAVDGTGWRWREPGNTGQPANRRASATHKKPLRLQ